MPAQATLETDGLLHTFLVLKEIETGHVPNGLDYVVQGVGGGLFGAGAGAVKGGALLATHSDLLVSLTERGVIEIEIEIELAPE